ncbi:MAG: hypothetical protein AB1416_07965, partial [Actinomycetota bacterium]
MTVVAVRPHPCGEPVLWPSWSWWRRVRRAAGRSTAPSRPTADWCLTCWGAQRILEPARNGEGLVPVVCPACLGTGITLAAPAA